VGGLSKVLRCLRVRQLVLPANMAQDPQSVSLLRAARRRGTRIRTVSRGVTLDLGGTALEVLWPAPGFASEDRNRGSLVARLRQPQGSVLFTGDIPHQVEAHLGRTVALACDVLIAPHHGSRGSTSEALLAAAHPDVVLIPAAPGNQHGHPHSEVLQRLRARCISYRYPARDGWCGASPCGRRWRAEP
jgi:competence protein ComEC